METALTFPEKHTTFETVKSAGLGFLGGAGFAYGLQKIVQGFINRHWSLTPSPAEAAFSMAAGSILGALWGFDKLKRTQIYNDRAALLNKYQSLPDIQKDILLQTGPPQAFGIPRSPAENIFSQLNNISFLGLITSNFWPDSRRAYHFFMTTTGLTAAGWLGAHISRQEHSKEMQHEALGHVERLALERAALRTAQTPSPARAS